jgi:hypothetical protein
MIPIDLHTDPNVRALTDRSALWVHRLQAAVAAAGACHAPGQPADLTAINAIVDEIHAQATPLQILVVQQVTGSVPCPVLRRRIRSCIAHRFAWLELGHVVERRSNYRNN